MDAPIVSREGDDVRFVWESQALHVNVVNIKEHSGDLSAIVRVNYVNGRVMPLLSPTRLNLVAPNSRRDLAKALAGRNAIPTMGAEDWSTVIETVCGRTYVLWERGEPFLDLSEQELPPWDGRELVKGLLPAGETTVWFADGGSGKSTQAAALSLSVLAGVTVIPGFEPVDVGPVMYGDWESNRQEHQRRLHSLLPGIGYDRLPSGFIYRSNYRSFADDLPAYRREAARRGAKLLVIDSAVPASGDDIKETNAPRALFNGLRSLGDGVTRLVLAHMSKAEAEKETGRARAMGSVMYENLARSVWELRRSDNAEPGTMVVGFYHRKMNGGTLSDPFGVRVHYDADTKQPTHFERIDVRQYPDLADRLPVRDRLHDLLGKGAASTREIAEHLGVTRDYALRMLKRRVDVQQIAPGGGRGRDAVWGLALAETW